LIKDQIENRVRSFLFAVLLLTKSYSSLLVISLGSGVTERHGDDAYEYEEYQKYGPQCWHCSERGHRKAECPLR